MDVVELCAGAGGQALGLERAGFEHVLAVELDPHACETLRYNRPGWKVAEGDVASAELWQPGDYQGVDLLAGGVPCPPFSVAGRQLGATDERDLFAWAIETCGHVQPRVLLLENVRGLSAPRFGAYREHVLRRLSESGYAGEWRLLHAADYGVPQLRPRFVLVAMKPEDMAYFSWPAPTKPGAHVGEVLADPMASGGWKHAGQWAALANDVAPTIVGGSKRHGGADLGPTRAKRAWRALGVDALGIADAPPGRSFPRPDIDRFVGLPKLTTSMVQRLQGWDDTWGWEIRGRKTTTYRQIGNAFPPPVAEAVGRAIASALRHEGVAKPQAEMQAVVQDDLYRVLHHAEGPLTVIDLTVRLEGTLSVTAIERRLEHLSHDFSIVETQTPQGIAYALGEFKAFTGQAVHARHDYLAAKRSRVS